MRTLLTAAENPARAAARVVLACFMAAAGPAVAGAPAAQAKTVSYRTGGGISRELSVAIDSVSPRYAHPGSTVRVSGTLTNGTGTPLQGLQVQLLSSGAVFTTPSAMQAFATGGLFSVGQFYAVPETVASGATVRWTASFQVDAAGISQFGVYPLEAQAVSVITGQSAAARTYLPYWPGKGAALRLRISWVWPLIGQPQQAGCPGTLTSNALASSLGSGGRLETLLSAGLRYASSTGLTWALDPALLSDVSVMTQRYKAGGSGDCSGRTAEPASTAADRWLSQLHGSAGEPMFVTPYADVDVAALSHNGLDADLRAAYALGGSVAGQILHGSFGTSPNTVWPADGLADQSVLNILAGQASTVILDNGEMPLTSTPYADDAVARVTTGIGTTMHVLLANHSITSLLGTATATSSPSTKFAVEQDFLAQTAMIAAERPFTARSVVIAPPRRWDPSPDVAGTLLAETVHAPWLRPAILGSLARGKPAVAKSPPDSQVTPAELSRGYLGQVKALAVNLHVYKDMLYQPDQPYLQSLDGAIAAAESSAWRGGAAAGGQQALARLSEYLAASEQKVKILNGSTKVTLAGSSGRVPVSIFNGGNQAIQVKLVATSPGGRLTVGKSSSLVTVLARRIQSVRLSVQSAAIGNSTVQLQLVTEDGSPLAWTTESISIQSTRYGRALLVVIVAALGVVVLTSATRWIRRWLADGRPGGSG
ncbi:MAG: hypothetical protein JOY82_18970 [Streptosporangiaceae bacterium]|nr:hypothetical protein [Streptosporangiaceae bacterium]MBV9856567.1 hypothetical protein [Streptosporangiaceae bacterium]